MKDNETKKTQQQAAKDYPGVAVNIADDEKVSDKLEKERVKVLGNNPRNHNN